MARKKRDSETAEDGGVATLSPESGVGSLESGVESVQTSAKTVPIELLPLTAVRPSPDQPRKYFDPEKMDELRADLARRGQQDPVKVKPLNDAGFYDLVDGERRWRCLTDLAESGSAEAALFIEAKIVTPADEVETLLNQLAANMHRESLTPVEEARAFARLREAGMDADEIANRLGIANRTVHSRLALLDLCEDVLGSLECGRITVSHADELVKLPELRQVAALAFVVGEGASVRALREWLDEQKWTKTSQREVVGDDDGEIGPEEAAMENAGRAYDRERDERETDVVGEAEADMERQADASARAEAARKERQADETPDSKTVERRQATDDEQFGERLMLRIAAALVKKEKDHESLLLAYARRAWVSAPYGRKVLAAPLLNAVSPDVQVITLADAARVLLALDLAEQVAARSDWKRLLEIADDKGVDIDQCKLEERAATLGVSLKELQRQQVGAEKIGVSVRDAHGTYTARANGKSASSTAGEASAVAALARKFGLTNHQIENGGVEEGKGGAYWLYLPKKARADKGKARPSPKVAKKTKSAALRAAVKKAKAKKKK